MERDTAPSAPNYTSVSGIADQTGVNERKKIGKILLVLSSQGMTVECFHCYPSPSGRMRSDPPFRRTSPGLIASIGLPD
ncbi:hypothetical protein AV530_007428 [Patagioenas fasciata monilis]|uniref:Uncharacterized protein n=1 Tax=Patagioenas fasciata monilis TaxID=372326 RepID=A0A1V4JY13_PATFA|nr:hypothetical protein AV530_007428 [Patagioenas fasciata monilis]